MSGEPKTGGVRMTAESRDLPQPAERLDEAQRSATAIDGSALGDGCDVAAAYRIQHKVLARRYARGERAVGVKLGFTSRAKMRQMGVDSVIVGQLTDAMATPDGGELALGELIHPRVEPEIAFRIAWDADLSDRRRPLADAVDAVAPALEVIDSRYRGFRFSLQDVIADNTSAASFVVGPWSPFESVQNRAVRLRIRGRTVSVGSTAAILGDPLRSLQWLVDTRNEHGIEVSPGDIVLAGAATAAVPLVGGVVSADVAGLGGVAFRAVSSTQEG